jgi:hypothetical protein
MVDPLTRRGSVVHLPHRRRRMLAVRLGLGGGLLNVITAITSALPPDRLSLRARHKDVVHLLSIRFSGLRRKPEKAAVPARYWDQRPSGAPEPFRIPGGRVVRRMGHTEF